MIFVVLLSTVLFLIWFYLLFAVNQDDQLIAAKGKLLTNRLEIEKLRKKESGNRNKLMQYHGISRIVMSQILETDMSKQIQKIRKENRNIQEGNFRGVGVWQMPGYVLLRMFPNLLTTDVYRKIRSCYFELYGKKHLELLTKQLMAKLLSYPIIGCAVSLVLGVIMMYINDATSGLAVMTVGTVLVMVLVYSMYDDVSDLVNKRKDAIRRQVPNVVSKLALLVTSGMIMDRAWNETAASNDGELYMEMRKTSEELNNMVAPEIAYGGFIDRCNTKETTKLASAIMQNLSKGNAEIALLLQQMANEAWNERRNLAKRDSENANSKLMIPTMLLFGAIMIIILVPIATSLGNGL